MPICNKICFLSGVIGFSHSEAALLCLDKAFSYYFSTCQQANHINFKEMTAIIQAIGISIEIFKGSHLHVFWDNFVVACGVQKTSIWEEAIQPLHRIAILYTKDDIKMQLHWISTKQNLLADILSRG